MSRKDDFPFRGCNLKRRAQRGNGGNLADRLAYDIYILISVYVERDYDFPDIGNIISSRSRLAFISTSPSTGAYSTPVRSQSNPDGQTRTEVQALQETTSILHAEMMTLKQNNYESISNKNNHISELKEALHQIGGLVHDLNSSKLFCVIYKICRKHCYGKSLWN